MSAQPLSPVTVLSALPEGRPPLRPVRPAGLPGPRRRRRAPLTALVVALICSLVTGVLGWGASDGGQHWPHPVLLVLLVWAAVVTVLAWLFAIAELLDPMAGRRSRWPRWRG
ncbi:MAG: hypothetical protein LWW86_04655 [Micrococcales bacterium]|nr:hypothetical protein [Micrococcales bacterium]